MAKKRTRILGNVTLSLTTEGGAKAVKEVRALKTAAELLRNTLEGKNAELAMRMPMKMLAVDAVAAGMALDELTNGGLENFKRILGTSRDIDANKERLKGLKKLEDAYIKSAAAGEPIFSRERYEELVKQKNEVFELVEAHERMERVLKEGAEAVGILTSLFRGAFGGAMKIASGVASGFFGVVASGFKEVMGSIKGDDIGKGISALSSGFGAAKKAAHGFYGGLKKGASKTAKGAKTMMDPRTYLKMKDGMAAMGTAVKALMASGLLVLAGKILGIIAVIGLLIAALAMLIPPLMTLIATIALVVVAFKLAADGMKLVIGLQEEYRTSAFRSVGSIEELIDVTTDLGISTKLGTKAAQKAVMAMIDAGITAKTLTKGFVNLKGELVHGDKAFRSAAEEIMAWTHITGIAEGEGAAFMKTMIELTGGSWDYSDAMLAITAAQKKYGLTGKDVTKTMHTVNKLLSSFKITLKDTNPQKLTEYLLDLQGAAKQAGVGVGVANKFIEDLNDNMDKYIVLASMSGRLGTFMNTENLIEQSEIVKEGALNMLRRMESMTKYQKELHIRVTKTNKAELLMFKAANQHLLGVKSKLTEQEKIDLRILKLKNAQKATAKEFATASATITQQLQMVFGPLMAHAAKAVTPFITELTKMGAYIQQSIQPLLKKMGDIIGKIFGVEFSGSGNVRKMMESMVDGIVKTLGEMMDKSGEWIKDGRKFLDDILVVVAAFTDAAKKYKTYQNAEKGYEESENDASTTVAESGMFGVLGTLASKLYRWNDSWDDAAWEQEKQEINEGILAVERKKVAKKAAEEELKAAIKQQGKLQAISAVAAAKELALKAKAAEEAAGIAKKRAHEVLNAKKREGMEHSPYGESLKKMMDDMGYDTGTGMFQTSAVDPEESALVKATKVDTSTLLAGVAEAWTSADLFGLRAESSPIPGPQVIKDAVIADKEAVKIAVSKTSLEELMKITELLREVKEMQEANSKNKSADKVKTKTTKRRSKARGFKENG